MPLSSVRHSINRVVADKRVSIGLLVGGTIGIVLLMVFSTFSSAYAIPPLVVTRTSQALGSATSVTIQFAASGTLTTAGTQFSAYIPTGFGGQNAIAISSIDLLVNGAQIALQSSCSSTTAMQFEKTFVSTFSRWQYRFVACGSNQILAGDQVAVLIGTIAEYQYMGTDSLTNPATGGVYTFFVDGHVGTAYKSYGLAGPASPTTSGGIPVSISGTVPLFTPSAPSPSLPASSSTSSSTSGGGGGSVLSAVIGHFSQIQSTIVNPQTVRIEWRSDIPLSTEVQYGFSATELGRHVYNRNLSLTHTLTLSRLRTNQTYAYRVLGRDAAGQGFQADPLTFTTPAVDAPMIEDLQITHVTGTTAQVVFYTNRPARARYVYSKIGAPTTQIINAHLSNNHVQLLQGLDPGVYYVLQVQATDAYGVSSGISSTLFFTSATMVPSGILELSGTRRPREVEVVWQYPHQTHQGVRVWRQQGIAIAAADESRVLGYQGTDSYFLDTTVDPSIAYTYCVELLDADGNVSNERCMPVFADQGVRMEFTVAPQKRLTQQGRQGTSTRVMTTIRSALEREPSQKTILDVDTNGRGVFTVLNAILETSRLSVKGRSHLRQSELIGEVLPGQTVSVDFTKAGSKEMVAGDLYQAHIEPLLTQADNFINGLDLSVLIRALSSADVISDLDGDGKVTALDLSLLVRNLNHQGESW